MEGERKKLILIKILLGNIINKVYIRIKIKIKQCSLNMGMVAQQLIP